MDSAREGPKELKSENSLDIQRQINIKGTDKVTQCQSELQPSPSCGRPGLDTLEPPVDDLHMGVAV